MYINMSDYTYSFSTSTSNTYTWNPAYPVWGNTTSNTAQPTPGITMSSNGIWMDGKPVWVVCDPKELEMPEVNAEELDDVLEEVS